MIDSDSLKPLGLIGAASPGRDGPCGPANDGVIVAAPIAGLVTVYHDP